MMMTIDMKTDTAETTPISLHDFAAIVDEVQAYLLFLKSIGCRDDMIPGRTLEIVDRMACKPCASGFPDPAMDRVCAQCALFPLKRNPVFGAGPDNSRVMFVGGVPEAGDEASGIPFSGPSGELLTRIIGAMTLDRESVYITNIVKCRPEDGCVPDKMTGHFCRVHLESEIKRVRPGVIVVLGEYPARILLKTSEPLVRLRGRFLDFHGIPVMPTHDPGYLLENPSAKRAVWNDMKQVMERISDSSLS